MSDQSTQQPDDVVLLRGGGSCIVVDCRGPMPLVVHWGEDLGPLGEHDLAVLSDAAVPARLNATPDDPRRLSILPTEADAWSGRPAIALSRGGKALATRFHISSVTCDVDESGERVELVMEDADAAAQAIVSLELDPHGVLRHSLRVTSLDDAEPLDVMAALAALPLPGRAAEILDFTGRWIRERAPQRLPVSFGVHAREQRRGRTGHDSAFATVVGTPGFANRSGEVWAMHVAWSGDQGAWVERLPEGAGSMASVLSGGELLRVGEVRLAAGETYQAPDVFFAWSDAGVDGLSDRFHRHLRARTVHAARPRPLMLNTWEAVYFDHDVETLLRLADQAARIGIERFVLDDGWFHGRHDDHAGLGDWWVDAAKWPDGLHPLVDRVRSRGMEFGLWVEPEMINPDSDTARAHPEWLLTRADAGGWPSRNQHVLDLSRPDAFAYVLDRLDRLVAEYRIDFLKWDHNRDLIEATRPDGHRIVGPHAQTLAVYALIDELRRRHSALEIESCASGGARIDLAILDRTDRVWASDCNDPIERSRIQRWTSLILPPELIGSHVAVGESHTTGRSSGLGFRLATSLFAHAGIEIDLTRCSAQELQQLAAFAELYREYRPLIHSGTLVNADLDDPATALRGVVAPDRSRALYTWAQIETSTAEQPGRIRLPGLSPDAEYVVRVRPELGATPRLTSSGPTWFDRALDGGIRMHASILGRAGLPMPALDPGSAVLLDFTRV